MTAASRMKGRMVVAYTQELAHLGTRVLAVGTRLPPSRVPTAADLALAASPALWPRKRCQQPLMSNPPSR